MLKPGYYIDKDDDIFIVHYDFSINIFMRDLYWERREIEYWSHESEHTKKFINALEYIGEL